jgi:glycosyltransferase involved in cell wall biosynthesis
MPELRKRYLGAEFTGYKTGEELKELIRRASFVVVPSEWYENCSMSVLEAMAYAKPVIGSRIGGIPEQIEDGQSNQRKTEKGVLSG